MRVSVLGAGGHAKVVIATLQAAGENVVGVYDDDPARSGTAVVGVPVLGTIAQFAAVRDTVACLAIGDNSLRAEVTERLGDVTWCTAVHPTATVHSSARLGTGTVIFAGAIVQPDCSIGTHTIINTRAAIDHDCVLGDCSHIAPGATVAGGVSVGAGALIGVGASVLPGRRIGEWAVVGGGSVVVRDVPPRCVVAGVPARAFSIPSHSAG